jgi:sulfur carrier protein ThiS
MFTSALQRFLPVPSAQVAGATIGEALTAVFASEPRLRGYVLDDQGALRRHVAIYVNGRPIGDRARLTDVVAQDDEIYVFQALSGGLEQLGSADPPLAVHYLHGSCHRERRRIGAAGTSRLGGPLGVAPTRLAPAHRSVLVCTAVCHQVAQRVTHRRIGVNAMAGNTSKRSAKVAKKAVAKRVAAEPTLLAGGNPQIAKADGDAPVQAYIAAMPGWKRDVGRRLDTLIVRTVPGVRKAVKWNSPFYGIEGQGWFLNFHCFTKYIKVAFFRGTSLRPLPPGQSKHKEVRYLDIHEDDQLNEAQLAAWVKQASELPGERM